MKLNKYILALGTLAIAAAATSCSDNESEPKSVGNNPLYNGIAEQVVLAPSSTEDLKFVKTPETVIAPSSSWRGIVRARAIADEDVSVKFIIDNTLVDSINKADDASYLALPDGIATLKAELPAIPDTDDEAETASRAATDAVITLTKGTNQSESYVRVVLTDDQSLLSQLLPDTEYVLPVRMSEVVGGSARLARSGSNISYLTFSVTEEMINPTGSPKGTIVPKENRQDWTGTEGGGASEWWGWDSPIRYETNFNYGNYPAGSYVVFDFGKEMTFDGIYMYPYYGSNDYNMLRPGTELLVSNDGDNWKSLGTLKGFYTTVTFYAPQTARYLKIVKGESSEVACTAFSIYAL